MMTEDFYKEGETLINSHDQDLDSDDGNLDFEMELQSPQQNSRPSPSADPSSPSQPSKRWSKCYVLTAAMMASLGGVLFGYDMGIISGANLQLRDVFCLSCLDQELVVSAMLMGAMVGSLVGGILIDYFGRRLTIIGNAAVFFIGAVILAASPSFAVLVVGRLMVGFAVSVSATGECIYISEIAPAHRRGLLVSLNELGITFGLLLAYLVNFLFISVPGGWRWMFALSAVPAVGQGVGMVFLPPSPRFLMLKKKEKQAEEVLKKLRGTSRVSKELSGIKVGIASEKDQGCLDLCVSEDGMRGRMLIGMGLVFFQQFTGQSNVLYYAPTIFEQIGFTSDSAATQATVILGVVKVLMTIFALSVVDRCGRRKLLMTGSVLMGLSILTLGAVCHFDQGSLPQKPCVDHSHCENSTSHDHPFIHQSSTSSTTSIIDPSIYKAASSTQNPSISSTEIPADNHTSISHLFNSSSVFQPTAFPPNGSLATNSSNPVNLTRGDNQTRSAEEADLFRRVAGLIALMCYIAAYGFSYGPVTWLVLSEIFPAAVKGRAISMATVFNWGTNLIVTFTFLDIMNSLGVTWTFVLYGFICLLSVAFIFCFVAETKGRTLEQVSADMKTNPPLTRMRRNCGCLMTTRSTQQGHGSYSRVDSETVA